MGKWVEKSLDYSWSFIDWFQDKYSRFKSFAGYYWDKFTAKAEQAIQKVQPLWHSTYHASIALYAFYNTAKVCVSLLPVIISSITLFAAIPFFASLSSPIIYASVISISILAGYFKYKDSVFRHQQDEQIQTNKQQIETLNEKVDQLEHNVRSLNSSMRRFMQAQAAQAQVAKTFLVNSESIEGQTSYIADSPPVSQLKISSNKHH